MYADVGDHGGLASLRLQRGDLALDQGELTKAAELYYEYLDVLDRIGGGPHGERDVAYGLAGLASVLAESRRDEEAAQLWGAVSALPRKPSASG